MRRSAGVNRRYVYNFPSSCLVAVEPLVFCVARLGGMAVSLRLRLVALLVVCLRLRPEMRHGLLDRCLVGRRLGPELRRGLHDLRLRDARPSLRRVP